MADIGKFIKFFHKHSAPIVVEYKKDTNIQRVAYSTVILSVKSYWFLITAGHCAKEIDTFIEHGYDVTTYIVDSLGEGAKHNHLYTFDYNPSIYGDENNGYDVAVHPISDYQKELLKANNITPMSEETWHYPFPEFMGYYLLGLPSESQHLEEDFSSFYPVLAPIQELEHKPDELTDVEAPQFYGMVTLDDNLKDIRGMSGGPIFGFHRNSQNEVRYYLVAIQSRWFASTRTIAAFPISPLGYVIEEWAENYENSIP